MKKAILTNTASSFALLVVVLICSTVGVGAAQERAVLTFALHVSFGEDGFNSSGIIPAINLALEHVNANQSIMTNYTLEYTLGDSKVY